ncbi:HGxxPAAW family protein [Brevibacterium album]|uniref:HGxxPAAW family protein n=1 Tax=Brevibacterium album TaxID=417948 RepID=UPI00041FEC64|nr:HGxxPAAW family protein [Brevibacterium album]
MSPTVRNGAHDLDPSSIDYEAIKDPGHGNTPAAWTGVFVMLIGIAIATYGNIVASMPVFWAGGAVAVIGLAAGIAMRFAGKGKPRR